MPGFTFPQAYDPLMHTQDALTLSRTTSLQQDNAAGKVNGGSAKPALAPSPTMTSKPQTKDASSPQRRHYVFADPVAFRWVEKVYFESCKLIFLGIWRRILQQ